MGSLERISEGYTAAVPLLDQVSVVLHRTRNAENVGAAVRAMGNMGVRRLILCDPAGFDLTMAGRLAVDARPVLEEAETAPALEILRPRFGLWIATTATPREELPTCTPAQAAEQAVRAAASGSQVAYLFGDERHGLPRSVLDQAHVISTIPTAPEVPSLNLAQAVLLHLWELRAAVEETHEPDERPPPMSSDDLARLRERAHALLLSIGYLNPDSPGRILGELERLLVRAQPDEREAHLLLALVKQLEWASGRSAR